MSGMFLPSWGGRSCRLPFFQRERLRRWQTARPSAPPPESKMYSLLQRSTRGLTMLAILSAPLLCRGQGTMSIVAGTGNPPLNGTSIGDGGPAIRAFLDDANAVAVDPAGNLYIWEGSAYRIRKVNPAGIISTVAGNGSNGSSGDGGLATSAQLGLNASG